MKIKILNEDIYDEEPDPTEFLSTLMRYIPKSLKPQIDSEPSIQAEYEDKKYGIRLGFGISPDFDWGDDEEELTITYQVSFRLWKYPGVKDAGNYVIGYIKGDKIVPGNKSFIDEDEVTKSVKFLFSPAGVVKVNQKIKEIASKHSYANQDVWVSTSPDDSGYFTKRGGEFIYKEIDYLH